MPRPEADTIYVESFAQLPPGGVTSFRVPEVDGSLQIENANVTSDTPLAGVELDVRTRHTFKQVALRRLDGKPFQIYHANPDFPDEHDDLSFIRNTGPAQLAEWQAEALPDAADAPVYTEPLRAALHRPVGSLVLENYPTSEAALHGKPGKVWVVAGLAEVRNAYALGKFLELAGKVAVRKLDQPKAA